MDIIRFPWLHPTYKSVHLKLNLPNATNILLYCSISNILKIWKLIIILSYTQLPADTALLNISERCGYLSQTICRILLFPLRLFVWARGDIRLKCCNIRFAKLKTYKTHLGSGFLLNVDLCHCELNVCHNAELNSLQIILMIPLYLEHYVSKELWYMHEGRRCVLHELYLQISFLSRPTYPFLQSSHTQ